MTDYIAMDGEQSVLELHLMEARDLAEAAEDHIIGGMAVCGVLKLSQAREMLCDCRAAIADGAATGWEDPAFADQLAADARDAIEQVEGELVPM